MTGMATPPTARPEGYFPQLDSLRTLAIGFVLIEHWLYPVGRWFGIHGSYGVWLFFTLSGFLITGILLDYRGAVERGVATIGRALRIFFVRRFLRILPVYYLFLAISYLVGSLTRDNAPWHLLYLSNLYVMVEGRFKSMGHLWSLSVEEQFYLVWPALILLVSRARVPSMILGCIATALVFRAVSIWQGWPLAYYVFPVACLDTLGLGALLAWLRRNPGSPIHAWLRTCQYAALIGAPLIGFAPESAFNLFAPLVIGLASSWLVEKATGGIAGWPGRIASFAPLLYLGRISYGLYLYHGLANWFIDGTVRDHLPGGYFLVLMTAALLKTILLVLVATASWYLFELPVNRLKRRFRLEDGKVRSAAAEAG